MAALQTADLGTPPTGAGGDDQRTANKKFNANFDVLSTQAALTTAAVITASQALTANHIGKRISVNITGGGKIELPLVSKCPADGVMLIRNVSGGALTLVPAAGSSDSLALGSLNSGETALIDEDGVKSWRILMRGRSYTPDETVIGNHSVGGSAKIGTDASIGRDLTVGGKVDATGEIQTRSTNAFRMANGDVGTFWRKDGSALYLMRTASGDPYGNWDTPRPFIYSLKDDKVTIDGTGAGCSIGSRPTFAGKTAWDSGNLILGGKKTSISNTIADTPYTGSNAYTEIGLYDFVHTGPHGVAVVNAFGHIAVSGTSSNVTVVYRFQLVDSTNGAVIDEASVFQDLLSVIGNWSNFYKYSIALVGAGFVSGRKYTMKVAAYKNVNVGPIALGVNFKAVTC